MYGGGYYEQVIAYADGCCFNNGFSNARAGIGVHFPQHPEWNLSEPLNPNIHQTNINAEIVAAYRAIQVVTQKGYNSVKVVTDSEFVINAVHYWMPDWKRNGWICSDGRPVKNEQQLKRLDDACSRINVEFEFVQAHSRNPCNDKADALAKAGAAKHSY